MPISIRSCHAAVCIMVGLGLLTIPTPAWAHRVMVFAQIKDQQIVGRVYFPGNHPAVGARIHLQDADRQPIGEQTTTDQDGRFTLPLPPVANLQVIASLGDGHQAGCALTNTTGVPTADPPTQTATAENIACKPATMPDTAPDIDRTMLKQTIENAIAPLREQIDQLQNATGWRDLLAGVGYLLGLFGLIALLRRGHNGRPGSE